MKKVIFYLIIQLSLFWSLAQGQYIEGTVKDLQDNSSISDVHIFDEMGRLRAVTDQYGDYYLYYEQHEKFRTSCIGYKSTPFTISDLQSDKIIYLSEDTLRLDEVIISSLSAKEIVAKAIKNIDSFYRTDNVKWCGDYSFTIEKDKSLIFSLKNPELEVSLMQNDASKDILYNSKSTILRHSDIITDQVFDNYQEQINSIFSFDHIIHKRGFLNYENLDAWKFYITGYAILDDKNLIIIKAQFIDHKGILNHNGLLFINEVDYGIVKVEFKYQWMVSSYTRSETNMDNIWIENQYWIGRANYIKSNGKYHLSNIEYQNLKLLSEKDKMGHFQRLFDYNIRCKFTSDIL